MEGISDLFAEFSTPDAFHVQAQMELFAWVRIEWVGHGYTAYTVYKCRCAACTKANRDYMRAYLARRKREDEQRLQDARRLCWRIRKTEQRRAMSVRPMKRTTAAERREQQRQWAANKRAEQRAA